MYVPKLGKQNGDNHPLNAPPASRPWTVQGPRARDIELADTPGASNNRGQTIANDVPCSTAVRPCLPAYELISWVRNCVVLTRRRRKQIEEDDDVDDFVGTSQHIPSQLQHSLHASSELNTEPT